MAAMPDGWAERTKNDDGDDDLFSFFVIQPTGLMKAHVDDSPRSDQEATATNNLTGRRIDKIQIQELSFLPTPNDRLRDIIL